MTVFFVSAIANSRAPAWCKKAHGPKACSNDRIPSAFTSKLARRTTASMAAQWKHSHECVLLSAKGPVGALRPMPPTPPPPKRADRGLPAPPAPPNNIEVVCARPSAPAAEDEAAAAADEEDEEDPPKADEKSPITFPPMKPIPSETEDS